MAEILDYAERRTRASLAELPDGTHEAEDVLEGGPDGSEDVVLRVRATIQGDALTLDFDGTAAQVEGNLNCPLSVTKSAAFFAVRVLVDPDAPPSAGAHRPVEVLAPEGTIVNARSPAAVAAGNVETSSRVADLVIAALAGALPAPAQGQGTMNNLTLARPRPRARRLGPTTRRWAAVRARARNATGRARFTWRCPTRSTRRSRRSRSSIRCGCASSPCGVAAAARAVHRGGDGIVRELEALAPMRYTLITERRRHAPQGRDGGAKAQSGAEPAERRGAPAQGCGRARTRGPAADRDPRRRWARPRERGQALSAKRNIHHKLGIRGAIP